MAGSGRVLHVIASTDRRGAETAAVELSCALAALGWPGSVVAVEPGRSGGIDVPVLGRTRFSVGGLSELRARARSSDVVIGHGSTTLHAVAAATIGTGVPFVYRSIGNPLDWATTPGRRLRVRMAVKRASGVVALWSGAAVAWHAVLGVRPERIYVIPNGADASRFTPVDSDGRRRARAALGLPLPGSMALSLGALSPEKRVDVAIRAVASLPDTKLAVVGEGPERHALTCLAAEVAPGRVMFLGQTSQPETVLAAADVLILSSDTEGQPAVIVEAGMAGLPVAATDVGGIRQIVVPGVSGVLVDRRDPVALARAVEQCLQNRDSMGLSARSYCERDLNIGNLALLWGDLLDRVRGGSNNSDTT